MPRRADDDHIRNLVFDDIDESDLDTQEGQEKVARKLEYALLTRSDLTDFDLRVIDSLKDVMKLKKEWSAMKLLNDMIKLQSRVKEIEDKIGHA